jgi:hypothetical protein
MKLKWNRTLVSSLSSLALAGGMLAMAPATQAAGDSQSLVHRTDAGAPGLTRVQGASAEREAVRHGEPRAAEPLTRLQEWQLRYPELREVKAPLAQSRQ